MTTRSRRALLTIVTAVGSVLVVSGSQAAGVAAAGERVQPVYDLLLTGGQVIDPRNDLSGARDLAVDDGRIADVATEIDPALAERTVDVSGLYVTPGLIDLHAHLFVGPEDAYAAGVNSVSPDEFTFRAGVTTAVDAGSAGWENFDDFKARVIDQAQTRVLAFLNIVGKGMAGGDWEQDLGNMQARPAARVAKRYPDLVVGIKTAHYEGPEWTAVERSVRAGEIADIPVMVDFGSNRPERPLDQLLTEKLRPGDIYTHAYSGLRGELTEDGRVNPGMWAGRERGVLFDVGHGGGSFGWRIAVPAMKEGFVPDTISTDLHTGSMNSGMKDMANLVSKFLALGMSLEDVVAASTWRSAQTIGRPELGHLSVGAAADIAVFAKEQGEFGYVDSFGFRLDGAEKLVCELTFRAGEPVWDLNGRAAEPYVP